MMRENLSGWSLRRPQKASPRSPVGSARDRHTGVGDEYFFLFLEAGAPGHFLQVLALLLYHRRGGGDSVRAARVRRRRDDRGNQEIARFGDPWARPPPGPGRLVG